MPAEDVEQLHPHSTSRAILERLFAQGKIQLEKTPFLSTQPGELSRKTDFDKVEGMLLGLAIGDALGNFSESRIPEWRAEEFGVIEHYRGFPNPDDPPAGLPSDDSQLAFWTLEHYLTHGGLVPEELARTFSSRRIYGIGRTMRGFIRAFKDRGLSWDDAGQPSAGNGALMRIAPVLVPHLRNPTSELWADTILVSSMTHNDAASTASCIAYVHLLWQLLAMDTIPDPEWWLTEFHGVASPLEGNTRHKPRHPNIVYEWDGPLSDFASMVVRDARQKRLSTLEACNGWHSGAYLLETVPSVLYILERHAHNPEEAIVRAVNDTRDNDTVAAIVGAAVGALHGASKLPQRWRDDLLGRTQSNDDGRVFDLIELARARYW